MTWVDFVVLAVLLLSGVLALFRGLVHEALAVGAWIGAVLAGIVAEPRLKPLIAAHVQPDWLATGLAIGGVFLVVLVILQILIAWIAGKVRRSALGGVDRALGFLFGLARGALIAVLAYIIGGLAVPATERWPAEVREARFLPITADGAAWLVAQLPPDFRPRLPEGAVRSPPGIEQLLRPPARERS
jgi:membrane protein required for colicin V production